MNSDNPLNLDEELKKHLHLTDIERKNLKSQLEIVCDALKEQKQYTVEQLWKVGGMAFILKAQDNMVRSVAIKVPRKDSVSQNGLDEVIERFKREAQITASLGNNRNVVIVYAHDTQIPFLAMEFVEGDSLEFVLDKIREQKHSKFGLEEIMNLMHTLLEILQYAHMHGVIHRDVKPSNIMLTSDNILKLTDWGISTGNAYEKMTRLDQRLGTIQYASPEQLRLFDNDEITAKSDIFSAGMILYELLTGTQPFGSINDLGQYAIRMYTQNFELPSEVNPNIHKAFDYIVKKAINIKPDERFTSAAEFSSVLKQANANPDEYLLNIKLEQNTKVTSTEGSNLGEVVKPPNNSNPPKNEELPFNPPVETPTKDDNYPLVWIIGLVVIVVLLIIVLFSMPSSN